jgi:hypothetical protein
MYQQNGPTFEPVLDLFGGRHSIQLSYGRIAASGRDLTPRPPGSARDRSESCLRVKIRPLYCAPFDRSTLELL